MAFTTRPTILNSRPEQNFFENVLALLHQNPQDVDDIYFTGALTDTAKTDFFIEYRGKDGRMHNYTPDFIVRRKDGKCLIVEVKREREHDDEIDGENGKKAIATRRWENLNPGKLKYHMIFVPGNVVQAADMIRVKEFLDEPR